MGIPFRDADDIAHMGSVGFLKIVTRSGNSLLGAVFVVNARGEPLEFTYNRVDLPSTFLWRGNDLRRAALRALATSLMEACPREPMLLLCLADEVYHELFCGDLLLSIPVCRIAPLNDATAHSPSEIPETSDKPGLEVVHQLFWFPGKPAEDSVERRLMTRVIDSGLLMEPFERASMGLNEVYPAEAPSG